MTQTTGARRRRPYAARVPAEQRREQLLDAALRIIVRDGYDAISMDAIAREAGVTRPVVYGAFDRLGPLLGALLDRQQQRAFGQLTEAMPSLEELAAGGPGPGIRRMVQMVRDDPDTWRPVLVGAYDVPAEVRARIESDRRRFVDQVAGLIRLSVGDGPPDPTMLAHAVLAISEHFGRLILAEPEEFDDDQLVVVVERLLQSFTQG